MFLYVMLATVLFVSQSISIPRTYEHGSYLTPGDLDNIRKYADFGAPWKNDRRSHYNRKIFDKNINLGVQRPSEFVPESPKNRPKRNANPNPDQLWPSPKIPYKISKDYDENERATIAAAFRHIEDRTCVRFVPREDAESKPGPFIQLERKDPASCHSGIGLNPNLVQQTVRIGSDCMGMGGVVHELMHRLGFFHEQSRKDRDRYVEVRKDNIRPEQLYNFRLYDSNYLGLDYDYQSLMHYSWKAWSKNGKPTIVPRVSGVFIGQRMGLSLIDVLRVNRLFRCEPGAGDAYWQGMGEALRQLGTMEVPELIQLPLSLCPMDDWRVGEEECRAWRHRGFCMEPRVAAACPTTCGQSPTCKRWAEYGHCHSPDKQKMMRTLCHCACVSTDKEA